MVKDYIPGSLAVVIGTAIITNWKSLKVEKAEDDWKFEMGSGAEETRIKNPNKHGKITIVIPQTSSVNLELSTIHNSGNTVNCAIVDFGGLSVHAMTQGTSMKIADSDYAISESSDRTWVYEGPLDINIAGGN